MLHEENIGINGIYKFENNINHKIYIGQAANLKERKEKHFKNITDLYYQEVFYRALRKYGWESFSYEILKSFPPEKYNEEKLNELEVYYIKKYNSLIPYGYNMTKGGHYSSELLKVSVRQYSLKGEFIKEYESISQASRCTGIEKTIIVACCRNRNNRKQAGGFQWRYTKENLLTLNDISNICTQYNVSILQFDLEGNFLKDYSSLKQAVIETGLEKAGICQALKHKNKQAYNYQWRYENDNTPVENLDKTVYKLDINTNQILEEFKNPSEACQKTKINKGNLYACLENKKPSAGGFNWIYKKNYDII